MDLKDDFLVRLKVFMPVFFGIVAGSNIGLAAFRWLFSIHFHLVNIPEEYWELWLPFGLPWIPVIIWFRRPMRILILESKGRDPKAIYYMIVGFTTVVTLLISQSYFSKATGKLETLSSINEIENKEAVRYYKLSDFTLDRVHIGKFILYGNSGGKSSTFNMDYYITVPILSYPYEPIGPLHKFWYGIKFHKNLDRRVKDEEMADYINSFRQECNDALDDYNYHDVDYFERPPLSKDSKYFDRSIGTLIKPAFDEKYIVLTPQHGAFEDRNGNKFAWIFGSFGIGTLLMLIAIMFGRIDETELEKLRSGVKPQKDTVVDMFKFLIPKDNHFATSVILDINILVFLVMIFSGIDIMAPTAADMLQWGGDRRDDVLNGEWWRLFTSMFVHSGFMHLFLNCYGLIIASIFLEPLLGRRNYFILYLLSGFAGSVASVCWHENTVSVGASGAIFGLFGACIILALINAFPRKSNKGILLLMGFYAVTSLLWGLTGGIDNAAHIGGLLCGTLMGILLFKLAPSGEILHEELSDETDNEQDNSLS